MWVFQDLEFGVTLHSTLALNRVLVQNTDAHHFHLILRETQSVLQQHFDRHGRGFCPDWVIEETEVGNLVCLRLLNGYPDLPQCVYLRVRHVGRFCDLLESERDLRECVIPNKVTLETYMVHPESLSFVDTLRKQPTQFDAFMEHIRTISETMENLHTSVVISIGYMRAIIEFRGQYREFAV